MSVLSRLRGLIGLAPAPVAPASLHDGGQPAPAPAAGAPERREISISSSIASSSRFPSLRMWLMYMPPQRPASVDRATSSSVSA